MINQRRALPIGVLVVGLLVALAGIAIVAGLWSKNLVIHGTVETGDVNVDWFNVTCTDQHNWNGGDGPFLEGEYLDKDVGWTTTQIDPDDHQIVDIHIHNGYPSYLASCSLDWVNTGSIPVNEAGFAIVPGLEGDALTNCTSSPLGIGNPPGVEMSCDELTVVFIDGVGQVDPCTPPTVFCAAEHSLYIHVEQPADQSDCSAVGTGDPFQITKASLDCDQQTLVDYHFDVKLCARQWNEAATLFECVDSLQHEGPPNGPGDGDGIPYWEDTEGPIGNSNGVGGTDDCTDGIDNDGDGLVDAEEPSCVI